MNQFTLRQKIGIGLCGLILVLQVIDIPTPPSSDEVGPPFVVLIADYVIGVIGLIALIVGLVRRSRAALRVAAGALILIMVTALPAFFAPVPPAVRLLVAAAVLVSLLAIGLMLTPASKKAVQSGRPE